MAENKISGWYYDIQQENPMTSVTLHPNTSTDDNGETWKPITTPDPDDEGSDHPYAKEPLIRAIVSDDFNVSIANTWSDFGGDMLGQMWGSVKTLAPYADVAEQAIQSALESYRNSSPETKSKVEGSGVASAMHHVLEKIGSHPGTITDYLNRSLVVQGTRFSYYNGTGVSFGNLMMKFTVFPKWEGNKFITVNRQINDLYPYLVGRFEQESSLPAGLENYIGWQKPPAGFKANLKDVDVVQEGTLKLKYGPYYSITNLVCENATFNFSKQMTKTPTLNNPYEAELNSNSQIVYRDNGGQIVYNAATGEIPDSIISPLYCDVTIQLRPATKFSDISLRKFVLGLNSMNTIKETNNTLKKNLKAEKEYLQNQYV